jgi:hypothetical protein
MADYAYNSIIRNLVGVTDGANRTFTTPTKYVSDSIKIIINGQLYEDSDDNFGWTEIDDETIELTIAPINGDILQAFYQDKESGHLIFTGAIGSPFDPNGILP